jgi:WD40 repeat protein
VIGSQNGYISVFDSNMTLLSHFLAHNQSGIERLKPISNSILVSCSYNNSVKFWNTTSLMYGNYEEQNEYINKNQVFDVEYIDNGQIAFGDTHGIQILTLNNLTLLKNLTINNHVFCLLYLKSNGLLASGDNSNEVKFWNVSTKNSCSNETCQMGTSLNGHDNFILDLKLVCETRLASASNDNIVILWDLKTFKMLQRLRGHRDSGVAALRFLFDTNVLASVSMNGRINLWNLNGTQLNNCSMHKFEHGASSKFKNRSVTWSFDLYDRKTLVSGSREGWIKFWDVSERRLIRELNTSVEIQALTMSYYSKILLFRQKRVIFENN